MDVRHKVSYGSFNNLIFYFIVFIILLLLVLSCQIEKQKYKDFTQIKLNKSK